MDALIRAKEYFDGKKITVMGLGLLGRGIGDTAFLAEMGADLIVTDMKPKEALEDSLAQLSSYPHISYSLGGHHESDFIGRDMILVAAGVPLDSPFLARAKNDGALLSMSGALFARLSEIPVTGITGTRGKSTVTHMIYETLRNVTEGASVILGGNVRGVSNLQLLKEVKDGSVAVMELDSWQLQGFGWERLSPQIAVFTNFMDDHLTYYGGDRDAYFRDKAQIFLHQHDGDALITTRELFDKIEAFMKNEGRDIASDVILVDSSFIPEEVSLLVPGDHNRANAALALGALQALSLTEEEVLPSLASFKGVPGRLELLGEKNGVRVYNDTNATTPEATLAGLRALSTHQNVVLIAGGTDKGIDLTNFARALPEYAHSIVLYTGSGTDKLKPLIPETLPLFEYETLKECVDRAFLEAKEGDRILFSPAFSSFGKYFKNEYDRGDQFVALAMERIE